MDLELKGRVGRLPLLAQGALHHRRAHPRRRRIAPLCLMRIGHVTRELFCFLAELARHNDREWFNANKARYLA